MQIVLLSGGSGKRLWPLSNDIRSKQFLKLLPTEDGQHESMVQRVYRQIRATGIDAPITIATASAQQDSIKRQLGSNVNLVLEPERRNTFPAIALAGTYLKLERQCSPDEVVVVLPVDPFTDISFFETMLKLQQVIEEGSANLALIGIKPTYPSAKYGYIIPREQIEDEKDAQTVARFTEKPSEEKAVSLIRDGALWNAGVFAFRLGWLMDIVHKYYVPTSYADMVNNYAKLKKDSFDYEVVEKESSIAVVTYEGVWKDLGTWNTLAEEMGTAAIGKVIIGEDTTNTNVINELDIPLVVLGAKDMVVAACADGILVSDKHRSSYLKPYVEDLGSRPMYEEKRWGEYKVLDYNTYSDKQKSLTKHLLIEAGKHISYQVHKLRDEIWIIVDGTGDVMIDGHVRNVKRGDAVFITKGTKHSIKATTDLHFIEVQIGEELSEDDIERMKIMG